MFILFQRVFRVCYNNVIQAWQGDPEKAEDVLVSGLPNLVWNTLSCLPGASGPAKAELRPVLPAPSGVWRA